MTSGTVPERHRELIPFAGLTGNARSETGAQCRSRGPCDCAMAQQCTADCRQRVSARGRNSNVVSAASASFAPERVREAGKHQRVRTKCERWHQGAQGTGGRATGSWHRRSRRTVPRTHHLNPASSTKEGIGSMVKPWAASLGTKHQGREASTKHMRRSAMVKITTRRACVFVQSTPDR